MIAAIEQPLGRRGEPLEDDESSGSLSAPKRRRDATAPLSSPSSPHGCGKHSKNDDCNNNTTSYLPASYHVPKYIDFNHNQEKGSPHHRDPSSLALGSGLQEDPPESDIEESDGDITAEDDSQVAVSEEESSEAASQQRQNDHDASLHNDDDVPAALAERVVVPAANETSPAHCGASVKLARGSAHHQPSWIDRKTRNSDYVLSPVGVGGGGGGGGGGGDGYCTVERRPSGRQSPRRIIETTDSNNNSNSEDHHAQEPRPVTAKDTSNGNPERNQQAAAHPPSECKKEPDGVLLVGDYHNHANRVAVNQDDLDVEDPMECIKEILDKDVDREQGDPGSINVPGAYNIRGSSNSRLEPAGLERLAMPSTSTITADTAATTQAPPITAVLVPNSDSISNNEAVIEEDQREVQKGSSSPKEKSHKKLIILGLLLTFVVVVVGLGIALATKAPPTEVQTEEQIADVPDEDLNDLWYEAVPPIDGDQGSQFGSSVSICSDGSRVAIGAQGSGDVKVFALDNEGGRKQIGQTITHPVSSNMSASVIRSRIVVELAPNCEVLAIGCPFDDVRSLKMAGRVGLYKYNSTLDSWSPLGNLITGEDESDFAGASVALSQTGDRIAIGSPGNDWAGKDAGRVRVFLVNSGRWEQLGLGINGTHQGEEFGGSISLSNDDTFDTYIVAVGSSSLKSLPGDKYVDPESASVARVFEFQTGQWYQRGQGITPDVYGIDTAWFVRLSTDGKKLVISNLYLDPDGVRVSENTGIYVAAFELDSRDRWVPRGGNIHRNFPGKKSGYIISLSDDGQRIGMGDPGRAEVGGLSGHAHFYEFIEDRWCQLGPNINGESAGDMAGYSISLSGRGDRMVVASPYSRAQGREHGRVYVVELHEDKIVPQCEDISK